MAARHLDDRPLQAEVNPGVDFRRMSHDDVPAVMLIEKATFSPPWTDISFHILIDRGCECWLLLTDEEIAGYGVCQVEGAFAHILNVCVREASRRLGHGRRLLLHLLDRVRSQADLAVLEVRKSNQSAIRLYLSLGFRKQSIKPSYYPTEEGREDAIVLMKSLR